jgi:hypothetical protein
MNKIHIILALIFISQTYSQSPIFEIRCEAGAFLAGYPNFNRPEDYFPINLKFFENQVIMNIIGASWTRKGSLQENSGNLKIDFSFSDQGSFFEFQGDQIKQLLEGKTEHINGTYEDGFDWSNGYNTRARFETSCFKVSKTNLK